MKKFLIIPFSVAALFWALTPLAQATANDPCRSWETFRPYLSGFFSLGGAELRNVVANYNNVRPRSDHHPDTVGYDWRAGSKQAQLIFVRKGCVTVLHKLPLKTVWRMMRTYPATGLEIEKP